jgi:hypothetical protein
MNDDSRIQEEEIEAFSSPSDEDWLPPCNIVSKGKIVFYTFLNT